MHIRPYEPDDLESCRALQEELVEHHREIYDAPHIGGDHPGLEFDEYLDRSDRIATWVAVDDSGAVIGLTGLLWQDGEAFVEPIVVARGQRREGVGRRLIETAAAEASRRGSRDLNIRPVARNAAAIRAFHDMGFRTVAHIQLFMRLEADHGEWLDIDLHDTTFGH